MGRSIATHIRLREHREGDGRYDPSSVTMSEKQVSVVDDKRGLRKTWSFDACHGVGASQNDIFEQVRPMLERVVNGQNGTIIAYGVTGSGKTYTMEGTADEPGVMRKYIEGIMDRLSGLEAESVGVNVSFMEILKDQAYDLLDSRDQPSRLSIMTNEQGDTIVPDLSRRSIGCKEDFEELFSIASLSRKTASTKLNSHSSRSHLIVTVYTSIQFEVGTQDVRGQLCLVDLAGSEKNSMTGNHAERLQESKFINSSLTSLSRVIDAVRSKAKVVPYRDCKLTRVLQPALSGHTQAILICCLAPGKKFLNDTVNTLDFAKRSKQVEQVQIHDDANRRTSCPGPTRSRPPSVLSRRPQSASATVTAGGGAKQVRPSASSLLSDITNTRTGTASSRGYAKPLVEGKKPKVLAEGTVIAAPESSSIEELVEGTISEPDSSLSKTGSIAEIIATIDAYVGDNEKFHPVEPSSGNARPTELATPTTGDDKVECISTTLTTNDTALLSLSVEEQLELETPSKLNPKERDLKARELVKKARQLQTQGDLLAARKMFLRASRYMEGNMSVKKRIAAIEAELLGNEETRRAEAVSGGSGGRKRPVEEAEAQGETSQSSRKDGPKPLLPSQLARISNVSEGYHMPSPAKRSRA